MENLTDKIVFITGASSGIGEACAKAFAQQGSRLIICARREKQLQALAHTLQKQYGKAVLPLTLDITDNKLVKTALSQLPASYQPIDILVNNAGLAKGLDSFQDGNIDDWEQMIDTNIKGLLYITKAIIPSMLKRNSGHIINIGSIAGHTVYPKGAIYCATKHAVNVINKGLKLDLFGTKIRVSSVDPGIVKTEFYEVRFSGDKTKANAVFEGMTPLSALDIAETILFCATRPPHVNISEIILLPTDQAASGIVDKSK